MSGDCTENTEHNEHSENAEYNADFTDHSADREYYAHTERNDFTDHSEGIENTAESNENNADFTDHSDFTDEALEEMDRDALVAHLRQLRRELGTARQQQSSDACTRDHRRLGLHFATPNNRREEKREDWDENIAGVVRENIPYLVDRDDKAVVTDEDAVTHSLIKGDNFPALLALHAEYAGMIDVIYIDPPYNTGNRDFIYHDNYRDDGRGRGDQETAFGHSRWLSFMARRLLVARELLTEQGVIFVSIDDHEQAHLKMLMDDIFGAENFMSMLIRKTRSVSNSLWNGMNTQHEYCLFYAKDAKNVVLRGKKKDLSKYKNPDDDPEGPWASMDPTAPNASLKEKTVFPIENPYTKKVDVPSVGREWAFSRKTFEQHLSSGRIIFKKSHRERERGFIYKGYLKNLRRQNVMMNSLDLADNRYLNQVATRDLNVLWGKGNFSYPKGVAFIRHLLSFFGDDITVLDFFAGSGTTGHAVSLSNAEDGGSRTCILVTDSGKTDQTQNGDMSGGVSQVKRGAEVVDGVDIAEDVTHERMRRVLTGEDWAAPQKAYATGENLRMREVCFLPRGQSEEEDMAALRELSSQDAGEAAQTGAPADGTLHLLHENSGEVTESRENTENTEYRQSTAEHTAHNQNSGEVNDHMKTGASTENRENIESTLRRLYDRWLVFADDKRGDLARWD